MGVCFSKKKPDPAAALASPSPLPTSDDTHKKKTKAVENKEEEKQVEAQSPKQFAASAAAAAEKPKKSTSNCKEEKKKELDANVSSVFVQLPRPEEARVATPIRTSSCTKEEVDAILIQCGRLSRSSSGKTEAKKYSGSKRSFDFDNEKMKDEEEDCEKPVSRPSPRRRTPNRERSGSRERGSNQRRVSRSPNRRSEGSQVSSSVASCDKMKQQQQQQQPPAKLVSVPAREKGVQNVVGGNKRNASPRSRSPANSARASNENSVAHQPAQAQSLSRSSSRKAEQSPSRRNPMAEIDENSLKGNHSSSNTNNKSQKSKEGEECVRKATQTQTQTQKMNDQRNSSSSNTATITNCVRDQLKSCRAKEKQVEPEIVQEAAKDPKGFSKGTEPESLNNRTSAKTRSSRGSSRDLDNILGPNASAYTSLLLEDIQNYHHQNAGFSLPACVSKACSILEAVADLNSSSSDLSNYENARFGRRGLTNAKEQVFVESEIVVKDDLMEPSLHKYISVRDIGGEMEPQESAGSNSFVGQTMISSWEHNSVDSTDRYSNTNYGEEVEESSVQREAVRDFGSRGPSLKSGNINKKREVDNRGLLRRGGRDYSLPVAAASS